MSEEIDAQRDKIDLIPKIEAIIYKHFLPLQKRLAEELASIVTLENQPRPKNGPTQKVESKYVKLNWNIDPSKNYKHHLQLTVPETHRITFKKTCRTYNSDPSLKDGAAPILFYKPGENMTTWLLYTDNPSILEELKKEFEKL